MNTNSPSQQAREKSRFSQLQKSHKALLATLQAVLDSGQLPPTGPTRAQVEQAIAEHTDPFTKNRLTQYRIVWWERPLSLHQPRVVYVLAENEDHAKYTARVHIEKTTGIVNFEFTECTVITDKPTGVVR